MNASATHPRYQSTRGRSPVVPFSEALLGGLAPDGGLYVPAFAPRLSEDAWRGAASFEELAFRVLAPWIGDEVPEPVLRPLLADALSFPVPLVSLSGRWAGVYVLELFHGPTLSFKDFGARTMARLMEYFLQDRRERVQILVATSGDTGSAVADGFAGQDRIEVVLLYPKGKVSPIQEVQLIVRRPGVRTFAVEGTFDDCQRMVKAAFAGEAPAASVRLSSANSINMGRLLPQMLYYFWAAREGGFDRFNVCVPSGNLGNLTGGLLAARSGLPVNRFLAAHNANDFFPRYLEGKMDAFKPSVPTPSNAMDVGAPSNFERVRHLFTPEELEALLWGTSVSDEATLGRMRSVYEETGYLADPHTAVGLEAARRYRETTGDLIPLVVLSTAHPAKFPETVAAAVGVEAPRAEALERLRAQPTDVEPLAPTVEALRDAVFQPEP